MFCMLLNFFGYLFTKDTLNIDCIYLTAPFVFQILLHIIICKKLANCDFIFSHIWTQRYDLGYLWRLPMIIYSKKANFNLLFYRLSFIKSETICSYNATFFLFHILRCLRMVMRPFNIELRFLHLYNRNKLGHSSKKSKVLE